MGSSWVTRPPEASLPFISTAAGSCPSIPLHRQLNRIVTRTAQHPCLVPPSFRNSVFPVLRSRGACGLSTPTGGGAAVRSVVSTVAEKARIAMRRSSKPLKAPHDPEKADGIQYGRTNWSFGRHKSLVTFKETDEPRGPLREEVDFALAILKKPAHRGSPTPPAR